MNKKSKKYKNKHTCYKPKKNFQGEYYALKKASKIESESGR